MMLTAPVATIRRSTPARTTTVRSLDALKEQLGGCSHMAKKELSPVETQDIIKYLNDRFYRFP